MYGKKVKDAIEEVFIILLQVLSEKHIGRGFGKAMGEMERWRPGVEGEEEEGRVAPLVQFFELVHIGDTIQQMVGVYFDKEMVGLFLFGGFFCFILFFLRGCDLEN